MEISQVCSRCLHTNREREERLTLRILNYINKRDRFSVALYATEERSPGNEKLYAGQNRGGKKKKKKKKRIGW